MTFNVQEFRSNMIGDGARPNLFSVTLVFPSIASNGSAAGQKATFMAKAAQLPGSSVNQITQHYFGREVKFAGNRRFADWTLQIINDEDFLVRDSLESWLNAINSHEGNLRNAAAGSPNGYTVDALVTQYGKTGNAIKTYNFVGMFPVDVAPINLDWSANDAIEDYSATFAYQYWTSNTTT